MSCIPGSLKISLTLLAASKMMDKVMEGGGICTNVVIIQNLIFLKPETSSMKFEELQHVDVVYQIRRVLGRAHAGARIICVFHVNDCPSPIQSHSC